jgi:hypothetical protein
MSISCATSTTARWCPCDLRPSRSPASMPAERAGACGAPWQTMRAHQGRSSRTDYPAALVASLPAADCVDLRNPASRTEVIAREMGIGVQLDGPCPGASQRRGSRVCVRPPGRTCGSHRRLRPLCPDPLRHGDRRRINRLGGALPPGGVPAADVGRGDRLMHGDGIGLRNQWVRRGDVGFRSP